MWLEIMSRNNKKKSGYFQLDEASLFCLKYHRLASQVVEIIQFLHYTELYRITVLDTELFHFNPYSGQAFAPKSNLIKSHKPFILIFCCGEAQSTGKLP